jgi:hypothetical protein
LEGTIIKGFEFASVPQIAFEIWQNDGNGNGYTEVSRVKFLPDDGFGGSDWDKKITVALEESIFEVFDADWEPVGVAWVESAEIKPANFSDFSGHAELLENLLGAENVFSNADYSIYGSNLVAVDFNKDGATDVFITDVVSDGEWQEIRDPDTLQVIGGLFAAPSSDFARLPSSEEQIAIWAQEFFDELASIPLVDEDGIDEASILNLMSDAVDRILAPGRFTDQSLDAQVQIYDGLEEDGSDWESIGVRIMDGDETLDRIWVNKEVQGDGIEYSVAIRGTMVESELRLLTENDIYTSAYSDLIAAIEI